MFSSEIMIALQVQAIESLEQKVASLRAEMGGSGDRDQAAHLQLDAVERILNRIYAERGQVRKQTDRLPVHRNGRMKPPGLGRKPRV